jgi:hypothetical protein
MSQVTLYLPEVLAKKLKSEAKRLRMSLSAYVAQLASREVAPNAWSKQFLATFGSCKLTEGADLPFEKRDPL